MVKKVKPSGEEEVAAFLEHTSHPLKYEIVELRRIILSSRMGLTEHIKWNAPSFCFEGEDRFTFKLNSPKVIDIVLHRGAKVKELPPERLVEDPQGLLKWAATDRAVASFTDMDDIKNKEDAFTEILNRWIVASS